MGAYLKDGALFTRSRSGERDKVTNKIYKLFRSAQTIFSVLYSVLWEHCTSGLNQERLRPFSLGMVRSLGARAWGRATESLSAAKER